MELVRQKKKGEARTSKIPIISVQDDRNGKYAVSTFSAAMHRCRDSCTVSAESTYTGCHAVEDR